jgi:hypothetical protein
VAGWAQRGARETSAGEPAGQFSDPAPEDGIYSAETITEPPGAEVQSVGLVEPVVLETDDDAARAWREGALVAERFRLVRVIGQGGMGRVYLAQDEALGRPIALKRIPREIVSDADARDDLRLEANRLLDLAHENIVRVHTYYDGPTWPFFAMEYLQGPTLKQLLHQRKRAGTAFTPEEVLVVARQVCRGLAHAHRHKIVHRDLKPANLMLARPAGESLGDSDLIKITDFGISRVVADSTLRQTGRRSGTLPYMSPEQFRGEACTPRSDIYSLACTLYELAWGAPPFVTGDIGYQILHVEPRPLEGVPKPLAAAIARALAKDPEERFETVEDFVAALDGSVPVPVRPARRGFRPLAAKMVAGIAFAALVLYAVSQVYNTPLEPLPGDGASIVRVPPPQVLDALKGWLKKSLNEGSALPPVVGKRHASAIAASGRSIDLELKIPEKGAPGGVELLSRVVFELRRKAPVQGRSAEAPGRSVPALTDAGERVFRFLGVSEGDYELIAVLTDNGKAISNQREELIARQLKVDLTPPEFEGRARDPDALVESARPGSEAGAAGAHQVLATFEEQLEVWLAPGGSAASGGDDIVKASYWLVTPQWVSNEFPISSPRAWRVPQLRPGESQKLRIVAEDSAGNSSADREVIFRRYRMALEKFDQVEVIGNQVSVRGVFQHESDAHPDLVFFVNDRPVEAEWSVLSGETRPPQAAPAPFDGGARAEPSGASETPFARVTFEGRVPLDGPSNVVEVKYAWKKRAPQAFPGLGRLESVKIRAPRVVLDVPGEPFDPGMAGPDGSRPRAVYTRKNRVRVEGTVEPYFAGLNLDVHVLKGFGGESHERVAIDPMPGGTSARFSKEVELEPGVGNVITVSCSHVAGEKDKLQPAPEPLTVYCDQAAPEAALSLQPAGEHLLVRVHADERLRALRGRFVPPAAASGMIPWLDIPLGAPSGMETETTNYTWRTAMPSEPVSVQVELTDLAGNVGTAPEYFDPHSASVLPSPAGRAGPVEGKTGVDRSPPQGTIVLRAPFLREVGMQFKVCGASRLEIASTEVTETAWFLFLTETGERAADDPPGRTDRPMVLEDRYVKLLPEFIAWFERKAADGYRYSVPRVDEWLCGFTGARSAEAARREVSEWFADRAAGFAFQQSERYGINRPSRIGSRPRNATPTGLLDMEANLQEIVTDERGLYAVIGGHNQLDDAAKIERYCLSPRRYDTDVRELLERFTGVRLARRPKGSE